jgi:hypothetical protein
LPGAPTHPTQAGGQRPNPGLAEGRHAGISGVLEDARPRRAVPGRLAAAGRAAPGPPAPAHLANADALAADPLKDLTHDAGLVLLNLVAGHPPRLCACRHSGTLGHARQHAHRTLVGGVPLTAPAALQDLGTRVCGHHALHWQQKLVLRRDADRAVEAHHLDPGAAKLADQRHLAGMAAGEAAGRMDVHTVEVTGGGGAAQALGGGAHQGGAIVTFVAETFIGRQRPAVPGKAGLQGRGLAADGAAGGLPPGADAGMNGSAYSRHACFFLETGMVADVAWPGEPHVSGRGRSRRSMIGNSRSKAPAMTGCSSRLAAWLT